MHQKQFNRQSLIKNILTQTWPTPHSHVYYVLAYKESDSGLLFNERILVLQQQKFTLFYTKYAHPISWLQECQLNGSITIKQQLNVLCLIAERTQNLVKINFSEGKTKRQWVFKFSSESLAQNWMILLGEVQEKCVTKSIKSKQTESTSHKSEYNSILGSISQYQLQGSGQQYESHLSRVESRQRLAIKRLQ